MSSQSPLLRLPVELAQEILAFLPDVFSLRSAALPAPSCTTRFVAPRKESQLEFS